MNAYSFLQGYFIINDCNNDKIVSYWCASINVSNIYMYICKYKM